MKKSKLVRGSSIVRSLVTISIGMVVIALYFGLPKTDISLPPSELTYVSNVEILSDPAKKEGALLEVKGKDDSGKTGWWYFAQIHSLKEGLIKGKKLEVLISASADAKHGGQGYIWQVKDADSGKNLMTVAQAKNFRDEENVIRYFKLWLALFFAACIAIAAYITHIKNGKNMIDMAR